VPGLRGVVERQANLRYRGFDLDGRPIERVASGFTRESCSMNAIT